MDDGLNGVEEQNGSGGVTADMLAGGLDDWPALSAPRALREAEPNGFTRTDSAGTNTMLRDGMNSTEGLVNSAGALATQFTYEPFGRTTFSGAGTSNLYRFTGRELDVTGLYFMRARYYNPVSQRFLSPDPIGFAGGSPNLYLYAFNSPTNFTDPLGLIGGTSGCATGACSLGRAATGAIGGLYGCGGGGMNGDYPSPPAPGPSTPWGSPGGPPPKSIFGAIAFNPGIGGAGVVSVSTEAAQPLTGPIANPFRDQGISDEDLKKMEEHGCGGGGCTIEQIQMMIDYIKLQGLFPSATPTPLGIPAPAQPTP